MAQTPVVVMSRAASPLFGRKPWQLALSLVPGFLLQGCIGPTSFILALCDVQDAAPHNHRGAVNGITSALSSFAIATAPLMSGSLWAAVAKSGIRQGQLVPFAAISALPLVVYAIRALRGKTVGAGS